MKYCPDCRVEKPLTDFYFHKKGKQAGRPQSYCKTCCSARSKQSQYRHWDRVMKRNERWRLLNADRIKLMRDASNAVNWAIKQGKIQRGTVCSHCQKETYVEAAHFDYSKKMEFLWLCRSCHRKEDHRQPKSVPILIC